MHQIQINLPTVVEVIDYHEFGDIEHYLKQMGVNVKIEEIGCYGKYIGIVYVKKDKDFKDLVRKYENEYDQG